MTDPHILSAYDEELKELRSVVSRMGGMAIDQLLAAMQALREVNTDEAETVLKNDLLLDKLELHAEKTAIGVFARRAPVADDLREVVSSIKMTTMIERMGDYAKNISRRTLDIAECSPVVMPQTLDNMADVAHRMIEDIMDAYVHRNADVAVDVWERGETLDNMHNAAYRQILARMMEVPDHINAYTHYLMIAKNLERIGDQATSIAEQIYYAITGEILEDIRPAEEEQPAAEAGF
ncbi:phosphate signaling complex protein PhoU [Kordiimonas sp. SCSIO 12603]|uniref:phosphate signaling complex protein PhoU n=1 Tax=Kordiimonas sp. SCSIO 12603 TaxID=2829596 RepID=UPI00210284FB|nr:phosphate signaling complex protein PhoU [Kordiimonas sp. SCSIO 12603]UTW57576.1 phosphate signaling complex protein PhoU [Kordiimonas sp. SCSIO 12603]